MTNPTREKADLWKIAAISINVATFAGLVAMMFAVGNMAEMPDWPWAVIPAIGAAMVIGGIVRRHWPLFICGVIEITAPFLVTFLAVIIAFA